MKHIFNKKGFTIIELIVVMAIIGILVLLAMPKFMGYTEQARLTQIKSDTKQIENASERYYINNQDWPRLTAVPYTSAQIISFAQEITDKTGQVVTLDATGNYYDIDYTKLQTYVQKPKDNTHYIIQNPVGEVYYLKDLTDLGKNKLDNVPLQNTKPTAVITMTPSQALTPTTNITWDYTSSTDTDGDTIIDAEWQLDDKSITKIPNGPITMGIHTMNLRVKDNRGAWSTIISKSFTVFNPQYSYPNIQLTAPETNWRRYDDRDPLIYFNNPTRQSYTSYLNTLSYTSTTINVTDYLTFKFKGSNLKIGTLKHNQHTGYQINIDGIQYPNVNTYSLNTEYQIVTWMITNLSNDIHTVTIRNRPDGFFAFDFIDIDASGYLVSQ